MREVRKIHVEWQVAGILNTKNDLQVDLVHDLSINSNVLVFRKGNASYIDKWTGPFKLLSIVKKTYKISLLFRPTNFKSTVVKPYLIGIENNDPNNTPKIKYNNQKNSHKEDHLPTTGPIAINLILVVVVTLPVAVDLLINLPDNHDCEALLASLARENSDWSSRNPRVWWLSARFQNLADIKYDFSSRQSPLAFQICPSLYTWPFYQVLLEKNQWPNREGCFSGCSHLTDAQKY